VKGEKLLSFLNLEMVHLISSSPALGLGFTWSTSLLLVLWTGTDLQIRLSWMSSLQTADCGVSQPPRSCKPVPHHIHVTWYTPYYTIYIHVLYINNIYYIIHSLCILLVLFLWRPWIIKHLFKNQREVGHWTICL
jgi:hypothetical protein